MLNFPSEKKRNKLNNPFRRTHLNRSTAFNASVFNACPVRGLIFFFLLQHSLSRWIFATAAQQRVSDLSVCTRLKRAEPLSNSPSACM